MNGVTTCIGGVKWSFCGRPTILLPTLRVLENHMIEVFVRSPSSNYQRVSSLVLNCVIRVVLYISTRVKSFRRMINTDPNMSRRSEHRCARSMLQGLTGSWEGVSVNYSKQITGKPGLWAQASYPWYEPPFHPVESLWLVWELEEKCWSLVIFSSVLALWFQGLPPFWCYEWSHDRHRRS